MTKLFATILLASTTIASAQPTPAPSEMTPEQKKAEAKAHYEKGNTHYNLGEFEAAIVEFKAAYALTSATGLLFNIAQSYRLKTDYVNASYFYKTFLRLKPDAPNRVDVEARIDEMDKIIAQQKAVTAAQPTGLTDPDKNPDKVPDKVPDKTPDKQPDKQPDLVTPVHTDEGGGNGKSMKVAGIATAGAGVALVITGLVFGSMASSAESDLNALSAGTDGVWTQEQQDKYDSGKRNNTIAIVSLVAGGAAIATGGVLYFLGHKADSNKTVAVVPNPHGATFQVGWSF